jgi:RNA polymerase sigma-70 factor (ECF subfamily)
VAEIIARSVMATEASQDTAMSIELTFAQLLQRCRAGDKAAGEQLFGRYRHYLWLLAQAQLGRLVRAKSDASDIVQMTMLEAHRDFQQFSGKEEAELLAWMRRILSHNLFNEHRRYTAKRRAAAREVSLDQVCSGVEHSSVSLGKGLADQSPRPSQLALKRESAVAIADVLAQLPDDYRTVLMLRILEGASAEEVAERMGRTAGAVRMLQLRALGAMRKLMAEKSGDKESTG